MQYADIEKRYNMQYRKLFSKKFIFEETKINEKIYL